MRWNQFMAPTPLNLYNNYYCYLLALSINKKPKYHTTNILAKSLWIRHLLILLRTSTLAGKWLLKNSHQVFSVIVRDLVQVLGKFHIYIAWVFHFVKFQFSFFELLSQRSSIRGKFKLCIFHFLVWKSVFYATRMRSHRGDNKVIKPLKICRIILL